MTLDEFLEKLDGVKPAGNGYVGVCPSHDDRESSLGVTEEDGKILLQCYAGCETQSVIEALKLTWSDLFVNSKASLREVEPEAIYSYTDEIGNELFQAVRFPGKKFRQRHQDPSNEKADNEGWVWNLEDVPRVPYRLTEVIEAVRAGRTVYITEGEKDAEALRALGVCATCNPMGAGKWRPEFAQFFVGAVVIIVADRDEPGRNHAEAIRSSLEHVAANIWVVEAKTGKDASDHLAAGHAIEDFKWIKKQRRGIVTAAELAQHARERLEMTELDLPGYLLTPQVPTVFRPGRMYAIGAYTGDGKTCLALQGYRSLATNGRRVGYFSLEMPEIDLVNRLVAHRGVPLEFTEQPWLLKQNPQMLALYGQAVDEIEGWNSEIIFESAANAEFIREKTMDREYEAIFIDHLHRFSMGDRHKLESQVKSLTNIALELNVLVVILCQLRKYTRGKDFDNYPRPTLQDFRETSQIGDDASMAIALWRQRDQTGVAYTGATEVIVLKNRHTTGSHDSVGKTWMPVFDPSRQMFSPPQIIQPGGWPS